MATKKDKNDSGLNQKKNLDTGNKNRSKLLPPKKKREIKPYEANQNLSFSRGSVTKKKRKGAGPGSGLGKTSGRGHKGQKSRSGGSIAVGFEGGQMPLQRRIPKRGFVNIHRTKYSLINLTKLHRFKENDNIDKEVFQKVGHISSKKAPVKLLGLGEVTKPLVVHVDKASKSAIEKIEKAGGKVILSAKKSLPKKGVKKDKNLRLSRKIKKMNKKK